MRVLILGGDGMLGHQLTQVLGVNHTVMATLRQKVDAYADFPQFNSENSYFSVEVTDYVRLQDVLSRFKPEAIVNAVGIVKQRKSSKDSIPSLEINALFPHRLAELAKEHKSRVIHVSTDCVFDGATGNYTENDAITAKDLYGMSKYLGELHDDHCLTIRTSIIGLELKRKSSLIEWFLTQEGEINGFENAIFSGFTTKELSRVISKMLLEYPEASGLYHASMDPINKFELLTRYRDLLGKDITIAKNTEFHCQRALDSTRFRTEFKYAPPTWEETLKELADDTLEKYNK